MKLMRRFVLLHAAVLLGLAALGQALAQDAEKPRHFRNLPLEERRQAIEKFRQERAQNPEKFQQRREEMRLRDPERTRQADVNRDGGFNREEAGKSMPRLARHFDEIDTNHDGIISREEMRAFREKRRQQRLSRGEGDPRF